jgi:hypothetical protein
MCRGTEKSFPVISDSWPAYWVFIAAVSRSVAISKLWVSLINMRFYSVYRHLLPVINVIKPLDTLCSYIGTLLLNL